MLLLLCFMIFKHILCSNSVIDVDKAISWGPGLKPDDVVLPARYFFIQLVDKDGKNLTSSLPDPLDVFIGHSEKGKRCRVWTNILDRNDGSYIIRYKLYDMCSSLKIDVRHGSWPLNGFPITMNKPVLPDECKCPKEFSTWKNALQCQDRYDQIDDDLAPFKNVDMDDLRNVILKKFDKKGSMSLCHYVLKNNDIYRFCQGQYVGFHVFMDAILLSLARKVKLPDIEFFVNLGDWPLEKNGPEPLPLFSWCGSKETADIVMPTYDLTESTLECMGRVQLDMLSVQGNSGPKWSEKKPIAFWRGRDSRQERLDLVDIARKNPELFNVSLTNFFFFRDQEEKYGPKQPHVSFFHFFKYKYQIAIDGTVASYRVPYLLAGGSLVFKQDSSYYEHFYRDLVPNEHYIPVKRDLSNLVKQLKWAIAHDEEAERIAQNAAAFTRGNLMPTHVFCYYATLFEEWSKKLSSKVEPLANMELVQQKEPTENCDCGSPHDEL